MIRKALLTRPTRFSAEPTTGIEVWGCLFLSPGLLGIDRETFPLAPSPFAVIQCNKILRKENSRSAIHDYFLLEPNYPRLRQ